MLHWLTTAFNTYVLHVEHNDGYQFWSGFGSDFGEVTIIAAILGAYKHVNCEEKGCWRPGHRHPDHGRPVCRKHYHHNVVPEKPKAQLED